MPHGLLGHARPNQQPREEGARSHDLPPLPENPPSLQTQCVPTITSGAAHNAYYQLLTGDEAAKAVPDLTTVGQTEVHRLQVHGQADQGRLLLLCFPFGF